MVLNLRQALRRLRRGSVLKFLEGGAPRGSLNEPEVPTVDSLENARGVMGGPLLAPFYKFKSALEACGM